MGRGEDIKFMRRVQKMQNRERGRTLTNKRVQWWEERRKNTNTTNTTLLNHSPPDLEKVLNPSGSTKFKLRSKRYTTSTLFVWVSKVGLKILGIHTKIVLHMMELDRICQVEKLANCTCLTHIHTSTS